MSLRVMAETANPGTNLYRLNQWTNTESAPSEYGDPAASTTFVVETSYTCSFPLALLTCEAARNGAGEESTRTIYVIDEAYETDPSVFEWNWPGQDELTPNCVLAT